MKITRFIPVYTGNIALGTYIFIATTVYPCVYREHCVKNRFRELFNGLSLCIQGTYIITIFINSKERFIPVYTGNIPCSLTNGRQQPVYPCVYREHNLNCQPCHDAIGLSLCIQGTYQKLYLFYFVPRFIPVCTGNMVRSFVSPVVLSVYPCVYREHQAEQVQTDCKIGLSLCVQGTFTYCCLLLSVLRFIPVCTGNIPIITYCFIIKILSVKFLPIFWDIFH